MSPWVLWKLVLVTGLALAVLLSLSARPPCERARGRDLGQLIASALVLYAVGGLALLTHHQGLAEIVYAGGILACAHTVWLSRGRDRREPPGDGDPDEPPADPDGAPWFDWDRFEAEFRRATDRPPAGIG